MPTPFPRPASAELATPAARSALSRRGLLRAAALAGGGVLGAGPILATRAGYAAAAAPGPADPALAADVRQEFLSAWSAYRRLAWGRDELRPLSGTGSDFFIGGVPLGLTIIEALDTLYLMELDDDLAAGIDWISGNLNFDRNAGVHVFESIIRLVGGLLSGYHATGAQVLLDKARDVADRLLPAFTRSPTGMPYRYVNLRTGAVSGNQVPLAEIGSNITEFGYLSQLTGDRKYVDAGKRALRAVWDRRSGLNLVGTTLNVDSGQWTDGTARIDPPVDSFFEYLWDGYAFLGDTECRDWYRTLTDAILRYQAETIGGRLWFKGVDKDNGSLTGRGQSELSAFYAGLLAQGGNLSEGERYHDSWAAVLDRHRLPPEYLDYTNLNSLDNGYQLRPEYVDSALFLWLTTGKELYRDRARVMWNRQKAYCKVANGYAVVTDMTTTPTSKGDLTPGYWFAENMKYYYLLWSGAPRFDYGDNYLTTEGNVLRGLIRGGQPPTGTVRLVSRSSGKVVAVDGGSRADGAPIVQQAWTGADSQRWRVVPAGGGFVQLVNAGSGKVLEVPGHSTTPGTQLDQWSGNGGDNQQWTLGSAGGGFRTLVGRQSGLLADVNGNSAAEGAAIILWRAHGGTNQQWQVVDS
jgi:Glycosyl hydrolase family 47/Ricin-type beta-trefoil lectin domain-like